MLGDVESSIIAKRSYDESTARRLRKDHTSKYTSETVVVHLPDDFSDDINLSPTHLRVDD
jgi:hypothetical protein